MPKQIMRTGVPPQTPPPGAAAPAAQTPAVKADPHNDDMRKRMTEMGLSPEAIEQALSVQAAKPAAKPTEAVQHKLPAAEVADTEAANATNTPAAGAVAAPADQKKARKPKGKPLPISPEEQAKLDASTQSARGEVTPPTAEEKAQFAAGRALFAAGVKPPGGSPTALVRGYNACTKEAELSKAAAELAKAPAYVPAELEAGKAIFSAGMALPPGMSASTMKGYEDAKAAAKLAAAKTQPAPASVVPPDPILEESGDTERFEDAKPVATAAAPDDEGLSHDDDATLAAANNAALALRTKYSEQSGGAIEGEVDRSDFKTPQLKIIQGSGPATINNNQGDLVFMDQVIFAPPTGDNPTAPMRFVPVALKKYFRENLPEGSQLKPRNALTHDEVKRLGGTTEFTVDGQGKRQKPSWSPAAAITLLIQRPDGCTHPGFTIPLEINGVVQYWAAAVYYVNGGAYRAFAKPVIDATNFILREGDRIVVHKRVWTMRVTKAISGQYTIFTPLVTVLNELTPPDLVKFAQQLLGPRSE